MAENQADPSSSGARQAALDRLIELADATRSFAAQEASMKRMTRFQYDTLCNWSDALRACADALAPPEPNIVEAIRTSCKGCYAGDLVHGLPAPPRADALDAPPEKHVRCPHPCEERVNRRRRLCVEPCALEHGHVGVHLCRAHTEARPEILLPKAALDAAPTVDAAIHQIHAAIQTPVHSEATQDGDHYTHRLAADGGAVSTMEQHTPPAPQKKTPP